MITVDYRDDVAVVRLSRSVTNALNLELVNQLRDTLERIEHDPNVCGLVLGTSSDKFFSIGFDIPQLFDLTRKEFEIFYRAINRTCLDLYTMPKPTVAALTGHAIAGGCILALCCDDRFIADGRKLMGLNEIKLGVPVPYVADCVLQDLVGVQKAREIIDGGEFYAAEASLWMGMVDQVLPLEQVVPRSIEKVRLADASSREAFEQTKRVRVAAIEAQVLARQEEETQLFMERWYSDEARERLREAMEKF
ncbi:MAG: enoyl-CoA hydratase/isomerase family protein [Chloroflexota bacterium]|nr:enoyl-CoA hydratase/isomerase family protein [Anaerolineae bacterium]